MRLTIRCVVNRFLKWCKVALSEKTHAAYAHQLRKFLRHVKGKAVRHARPIDLSTWAKSWHEFQAVIRAFNWAVKEAKIMRVNPFAACRLPCRGRRRRILVSHQIARMLRTARPAARLFLLALRETLARPQEIRNALIEQLQSESPDLPVEVALPLGKALIVQPDFKDCTRRKDTDTPRVLLVSRRLGRAIVRDLRRRGDTVGPLFENTKGLMWTRNAVRCLMRRLRKKLNFGVDARGEKVVAYTMRHSIATLAAAHGVSDRTLADLLGHVETRTTARYTHLQVGHLREAMRRFASDRSQARKDANRKL